MKKLFLIFLFLLIACPAWGATYYVSASGSNTSPYDTWAKAANLPSTAITAGNTDIGGDGPHIMYIAPGNYADVLTVSDTDWNGGSIIGTSAVGATTPAVKGQVLITNAAASHTVTVQAVSSVTIKNISINTTAANQISIFLNGTSNFVADNLHVYDGTSLLLFTNAGTVSGMITNSLFEGASLTNGCGVQFNHTSGTITISYCVFRASTKNFLTGSVAWDAVHVGGVGGTTTINNSLISGSRRASFSINGGTANLNNNVILGCGQGGIQTVIRTGGTLNLSNNIILKTWTNNAATAGTLNTDTNNIYTTSSPLFTIPQRIGYIIPTVDDAGNSTYAAMVETELAARRMKGSWAVNADNGINVAENKAAIQAMINRGVMSIAGHGYSHTDLTKTGTAYTVTKAGATIDFDRDTDTITINPGGTVTGYKAKRLSEITTELTALGCTTALAAGIGDTLGESLADSSGAQASPYAAQLLIDTTAATGFFNVEMVQAKALMEANFTNLTLKALVTPGSSNSASVRTATKAAGFDGSRSVYTNTGNGWLLNSINAYGISHHVGRSLFRGATDADTLANIYAFLETVSSNGMVLSVLAHNTAEFTQAEWQMLLDAAAQYPTIKVTDLNTFLADLKTSWTTADDITYTKELLDWSNYRPLVGSPLIDGGKVLGLTTDYAGKAMTVIPEIGIYEFQKYVPWVQ